MAAEQFVLPFRPAYDSNGKFLPGAKLWFTVSPGTDVGQAPFTTADLDIALPNPVVANGSGRFPPIYMDDMLDYRVRLYEPDAEVGVDDPLEEYDPYGPVADEVDEGELGDSANPAVPLSYVGEIRTGLRAVRDGFRFARTVHLQIEGYAKLAGTNGAVNDGVWDEDDLLISGTPYPDFKCESESMDAATEHSWGWCLEGARVAGGGFIVFDGRSQMNIPIDTIQYMSVANLTVCAPGRNVTFWTKPLFGSFAINAENHVYWGIEFRTMPGLLSEGSPGKLERKLINIDIMRADRIAFVNCEMRRASDGACDMSSSGYRVNWPVGHIGAGRPYKIRSLGSTTQLQWNTLAGTVAQTYAVGTIFTPVLTTTIIVGNVPVEDVTWGTGKVDATQCRVTLQDCILWDTDQPMLVGGTGGPSSVVPIPASLADPELLQVTLYNCIFAYCAERQPKVGRLTTVDMVDCLTWFMQPFQRDNVGAETLVGEFSSVSGGVAVIGGKIRGRGCLWIPSFPERGDVAFGMDITDGVWGAAVLADSDTEGALATNANDVGNDVPPVPYTLLHTPVPPPGAAREQWIADRWQRAGCKPDPAPAGLFKHLDVPIVEEEQPYPNGETVLLDRRLGGKWVRIDNQSDALFQGDRLVPSGQSLVLPRGTSAQIKDGWTTIDPDNAYMALINEGVDPGNRFDELHTLVGGRNGSVAVFRGSTYTVRLMPQVTKTVSAANAANNTITVTAHGVANESPITLQKTGGLDTAIIDNTQYWATVVDANTLKLSASFTDLHPLNDDGTPAAPIYVDINGTFTGQIDIGNIDIFEPLVLQGRDTATLLKDGMVWYAIASSGASAAPYVPVVTAVMNCTATANRRARYVRHGGYVTVTGSADLTITAVGQTRVGISLPFPNGDLKVNELDGTCGIGAKGAGGIYADAVNHRAQIDFNATGTGVSVVAYVFQYEVQSDAPVI